MRRADRGRELQIFADGEVLVERVLLRDVTDVRLNVEVSVEGLSVEQDLPLVGWSWPASTFISVLLPAPLAPITQTSSPRVIEGNSFEADLAFAEAVCDFIHLEAANDVALFLDDALGKIASQELSDIDSNGVAVLERRGRADGSSPTMIRRSASITSSVPMRLS
jgi:hypothetical protein